MGVFGLKPWKTLDYENSGRDRSDCRDSVVVLDILFIELIINNLSIDGSLYKIIINVLDSISNTASA